MNWRSIHTRSVRRVCFPTEPCDTLAHVSLRMRVSYSDSCGWECANHTSLNLFRHWIEQQLIWSSLNKTPPRVWSKVVHLYHLLFTKCTSSTSELLSTTISQYQFRKQNHKGSRYFSIFQPSFCHSYFQLHFFSFFQLLGEETVSLIWHCI